MSDPATHFTWLAIEHHDDGAVREFYRRLREDRQLCTTRCTACARFAYPPRPFCPHCLCEKVEWVPIGEGATLYAFTTQQRALRFKAPDVVGIVEVPGVGRIASKINAPYDALRIGQRLRFEPLDLGDELTVASFSPADDAPGAPTA
jgi:uncharacterized OB-fold protein